MCCKLQVTLVFYKWLIVNATLWECVCAWGCVFMSVCVFGWSHYGFAMQGPLDGGQKRVVRTGMFSKPCFSLFWAWAVFLYAENLPGCDLCHGGVVL